MKKAKRQPLPDGEKGKKTASLIRVFREPVIPGREDEKTLLSDALDSVPDEEIGKHLFWLSEKLGRTPFSVAFQIAAIRGPQDGWENSQGDSDKIRLSGLSISDYLKQNGTGLARLKKFALQKNYITEGQ